MIPSLVLLPGLDGSGDQFAPLVEALGDAVEARVVRYPNDRATDLAAHESAARSAVPTDRPFVLLGESFSGPIAARLAATTPSGIAGLILCASFVRFPRPALRFLRPLSGLLSMTPIPTSLIASLVLGSSPRPPLKDLLSKSMRGVAPSALRSRAEILFDVDARSELSTVTAPILYLRATRDRLVPASAAREVAALARHTVVADIIAPHFLLQAAPVEAAQAIRRFLDTCKTGV